MKFLFLMILAAFATSSFALEEMNLDQAMELEKDCLLRQLTFYSSKKITLTVEKKKVISSKVVDGKLVEVVEKSITKKVVKPSTPGRVVDISWFDDGHGHRIPWGVYVSFDPKCQEKSCAFLFDTHRVGRLTLNDLPKIPGETIVDRKFGSLFGTGWDSVYLEYDLEKYETITSLVRELEGNK